MIDAKRAVELSGEYYKEIVNPRDELRVEEVELGDDGYWYVTLSTRDPYAPSFPVSKNKELKVFKINAEDGLVKSMKIRKIND